MSEETALERTKRLEGLHDDNDDDDDYGLGPQVFRTEELKEKSKEKPKDEDSDSDYEVAPPPPPGDSPDYDPDDDIPTSPFLKALGDLFSSDTQGIFVSEIPVEKKKKPEPTAQVIPEAEPAPASTAQAIPEAESTPISNDKEAQTPDIKLAPKSKLEQPPVESKPERPRRKLEKTSVPQTARAAVGLDSLFTLIFAAFNIKVKNKEMTPPQALVRGSTSIVSKSLQAGTGNVDPLKVTEIKDSLKSKSFGDGIWRGKKWTEGLLVAGVKAQVDLSIIEPLKKLEKDLGSLKGNRRTAATMVLGGFIDALTALSVSGVRLAGLSQVEKDLFMFGMANLQLSFRRSNKNRKAKLASEVERFKGIVDEHIRNHGVLNLPVGMTVDKAAERAEELGREAGKIERESTTSEGIPEEARLKVDGLREQRTLLERQREQDLNRQRLAEAIKNHEECGDLLESEYFFAKEANAIFHKCGGGVGGRLACFSVGFVFAATTFLTLTPLKQRIETDMLLVQSLGSALRGGVELFGAQNSAEFLKKLYETSFMAVRAFPELFWKKLVTPAFVAKTTGLAVAQFLMPDTLSMIFSQWEHIKSMQQKGITQEAIIKAYLDYAGGSLDSWTKHIMSAFVELVLAGGPWANPKWSLNEKVASALSALDEYSAQVAARAKELREHEVTSLHVVQPKDDLTPIVAKKEVEMAAVIHTQEAEQVQVKLGAPIIPTQPEHFSQDARVKSEASTEAPREGAAKLLHGEIQVQENYGILPQGGDDDEREYDIVNGSEPDGSDEPLTMYQVPPGNLNLPPIPVDTGDDDKPEFSAPLTPAQALASLVGRQGVAGTGTGKKTPLPVDLGEREEEQAQEERGLTNQN